MFLLTTFHWNCAHADKTKSALKALEKGEFEKVEGILKKSLEKNSINPSSKYVYSILFVVDSFPRYSLDSAHHYITSAENDFDKLTDKEQESLGKEGVMHGNLIIQHDFVDSLAFEAAKREKTLSGYDHYVQNFTQSHQYDSAVFYRNQVAFLHASQEASWQSYKRFMDKYPSASDYARAKEEYNKLLFEEKTRSGSLEDLEGFLKSHPDTPYKAVLEKRIFEILSTFGDRHKISYFIDTYQNPELRQFGMDILYHIHGQDAGFQKLLKSQEWKAYNDSIESLIPINSQTLLPFMESGKYGFLNSQGKVAINLQFDSISPDYLCGKLTSDVLKVVAGGESKLINRKISTLYSGSFNSHRDIGNGVIEITVNGKSGAYHKSGRQILPFKYQEISTLNENFLKTKQSNKYGITSLLGKKVTLHQYDDIYLQDQFLIFEREGKISINLISHFYSDVLKDELNLEFAYDDFEIIDQSVICFDAEKEILLNSDLQVIVPLAKQRINTKFETWVIQTSNEYRLYDHTASKLQPEVYQQVIQNENWLSVKRKDKWSVYSKSLSDVPIVGLDSVTLLGENIALVFRGNTGMAIFPNKKIVEFSKNERLRVIESAKNTDVHFLVINKNRKHYLYQNGESLFESDYEIGYISKNVFSVKKGSEYGAVDNQGRLIMRIRYDAIGEVENGIAPVLYNGRFGAYNFADRILINLKYDEKLKSYNEHLLITTFKGKKGFYTRENVEVIEPKFEEILYWTDSLALAKQDDQWGLVNIFLDELVYSEILDFEFISKKHDEPVIKFRSKNGLGIYSGKNGLLIRPSFNEILNLGSEETPLYFCEKAVPEANYYAVAYKNKMGETVRTYAYREEEYDQIVCDR